MEVSYQDKVKKVILFRIPMSICNLRCHYCYLSQRPVHFEGISHDMKFSPDQVAYAIRPERLGGYAYINLCADGETLLVKDLDLFVRKFAEDGHFIEIVTNLTVTPVLEKILSFPKELLEHIEFKCSFHYLELKNRNKLELFAENVNKVWKSGASANIELVPSDELIPHIDEVIDFSLKFFGALPHLTIARDDRTAGIDYLTSLPIEEYDRIWSRFDSDFWRFKKSIFGKRQKHFCHAGAWSAYIDLTTGYADRCYTGDGMLGNVFENPDSEFPANPIGKCPFPHCYNGHVLLTLGLIRGYENVHYGDLRDREKADGTHWIQPRLHQFFNANLGESNKSINGESFEELCFALNEKYIGAMRFCGRIKRKILGK